MVAVNYHINSRWLFDSYVCSLKKDIGCYFALREERCPQNLYVYRLPVISSHGDFVTVISPQSEG